MARLRRTSDARNDLTAIWLYVAQDNLPAADRLLDEINHNLKLLLRFPMMGDAVDHLRPGVGERLSATISFFMNQRRMVFVCFAFTTLLVGLKIYLLDLIR